MATGTEAPTKPVEDTIGKVDNELAIGADLEFQRKWWKFEFTIWVIFTIFVIMDLLGCFGRGPLSNAQYRVSDGSATIHYERIERFATPSVMTINFGPNAIQNGKVQLWVSEDLVKSLGNQRVVPQPESSQVGQGGIQYTFPASAIPASAEFALQPTGPGVMKLQMRVPGHETADLRIIVMP